MLVGIAADNSVLAAAAGVVEYAVEAFGEVPTSFVHLEMLLLPVLLWALLAGWGPHRLVPAGLEVRIRSQLLHTGWRRIRRRR